MNRRSFVRPSSSKQARQSVVAFFFGSFVDPLQGQARFSGYFSCGRDENGLKLRIQVPCVGIFSRLFLRFKVQFVEKEGFPWRKNPVRFHKVINYGSLEWPLPSPKAPLFIGEKMC